MIYKITMTGNQSFENDFTKNVRSLCPNVCLNISVANLVDTRSNMALTLTLLRPLTWLDSTRKRTVAFLLNCFDLAMRNTHSGCSWCILLHIPEHIKLSLQVHPQCTLQFLQRTSSMHTTACFFEAFSKTRK